MFLRVINLVKVVKNYLLNIKRIKIQDSHQFGPHDRPKYEINYLTVLNSALKLPKQVVFHLNICLCNKLGFWQWIKLSTMENDEKPNFGIYPSSYFYNKTTGTVINMTKQFLTLRWVCMAINDFDTEYFAMHCYMVVKRHIKMSAAENDRKLKVGISTNRILGVIQYWNLNICFGVKIPM